MEDPVWDYYSSFGQEAPSSTRSCLYCGASGDDFEAEESGLFYCRSCGTVSEGAFATGTAEEDVFPSSFGESLYSSSRHRAQPRQTPSSSLKLPSKDQIVRALLLSQSQTQPLDNDDERKKKELERSYWFNEGPEEPRDFGRNMSSFDPEAIRERYVQGLQVMLQMQCEVLVEKFGVSPLVCGIVGDVWLRYVAASRVFEAGWAERVLEEDAEARSKAGEQPKYQNHVKRKFRMASRNAYGQQTAKFWAKSLRKIIPLYATLAISFLVCHVSREPVLPTDIFEWALEGKLPYLAVFADIDRHLGNPPNACPLTSETLFRPIGLIGAWQLEATAGSIAEIIGLRLPSVNFYAIACRYLKDLSLPIDKILPHACHIFEWSMPPELWLSSNDRRFPTRVCVMSILIIAIRILYNLHGQGTWERSLSTFSTLPPHSQDCSSGKSTLVPSFEEKVGTSAKFESIVSSMPPKNSSHSWKLDFSAEELLGTLEDIYNKISIEPDYSKDLRSYLKYCKEVVFVGMNASYEEELLAERLWDMYDKEEDDNTKEEVKSGHMESKGKRSSDEVADITSLHSKRLKGESQEMPSINEGRSSNDACGIEDASTCVTGDLLMPKGSSTVDGSTAIQKMKLDMEENWFQYIPPRVRMRSDGYLQYRRKMVDGKLNYAVHADYYILLRACAKLAQVDARIMHVGVLKLERRLAWIEQRIDSSLCSMPELSPKMNDMGDSGII